MRNHDMTTSSGRAADHRRRAGHGPRPVPTDRRTRHHMRELCDEVLASYRVATGRELLSDGERREARAMLARMVPRVLG